MPKEKKPILWRDRKRTFLGLPLSFTIYSVDEERLFIERGFFTKEEDEVRLYRIMDFSLKRKLGQRIFGVGTICCRSSDKTLNNFEIVNVKRPKEVKELLAQLTEQERIRKHVTSREFLKDSDKNELEEDILRGEELLEPEEEAEGAADNDISEDEE
ncbi:MAG: PH domain-containing protein [Lachnospiraceae bacterium]|nr:PH domain-containing protein [Lachnospiraceae bacterium]